MPTTDEDRLARALRPFAQRLAGWEAAHPPAGPYARRDSVRVEVRLGDLRAAAEAVAAFDACRECRELPKGHAFTPEEAAIRRAWAARFVTEITGVARGFGYGIATLGSMVRDVDLIAVPWQAPTAKHPDAFVLDLVHALSLHMGNYGDTLFGHRRYALWADGHPDHQIDLKVILPANQTPLRDD